MEIDLQADGIEFRLSPETRENEIFFERLRYFQEHRDGSVRIPAYWGLQEQLRSKPIPVFDKA